jgi:hypothetical protein
MQYDAKGINKEWNIPKKKERMEYTKNPSQLSKVDHVGHHCTISPPLLQFFHN